MVLTQDGQGSSFFNSLLGHAVLSIHASDRHREWAPLGDRKKKSMTPVINTGLPTTLGLVRGECAYKEAKMAFSEAVKDRAFARSKGRCECRSASHGHASRCMHTVTRYNAGYRHVLSVVSESGEGLLNCEVVCQTCLLKSDSHMYSTPAPDPTRREPGARDIRNPCNIPTRTSDDTLGPPNKVKRNSGTRP